MAFVVLAGAAFSETATAYTAKEFIIEKTEQQSFKFIIDARENFQFFFDANATMDMTVFQVAADGSKAVIATISNQEGSYNTTRADAWTCNVTLAVNPGYSGLNVNLRVSYTFMATAGRWLSILVCIGAFALGIMAISFLVKKGGPAAGKQGGGA